MKQFELFQVSKFTENLENNFSEKKVFTGQSYLTNWLKMSEDMETKHCVNGNPLHAFDSLYFW
jgi:hypothetical protein